MVALAFLLKVLIIISALLVILVKNPVHSILFLIFLFLNSAWYLLILNIDFLAYTFIIVYVGAIAVLFLFICMTLDIKVEETINFFSSYLPISVFFLVLFFFELLGFIFSTNFFTDFSVMDIDWFFWLNFTEHIFALGFVLYTNFGLSFLLSSLALLVAMIGSIFLTVSHTIDIKRQLIVRQIKSKAKIFK